MQISWTRVNSRLRITPKVYKMPAQNNMLPLKKNAVKKRPSISLIGNASFPATNTVKWSEICSNHAKLSPFSHKLNSILLIIKWSSLPLLGQVYFLFFFYFNLTTNSKRDKFLLPLMAILYDSCDAFLLLFIIDAFEVWWLQKCGYGYFVSYC